MVGAGVPIEKVARILGHTNPSVTASVHARFQPDSLSDAAGLPNFGEVTNGRPWVQRTEGHFVTGHQVLDFMVGDDRFELPTSSM